MPKKKRTRKDKIQTDLRREASSPRTQATKSAPVTRQTAEAPKTADHETGTFSLPQGYITDIAREAVITPQPVTISTSAYKYLRGDLLKTTILSSTIIAVELFIYFFLMK